MIVSCSKSAYERRCRCSLVKSLSLCSNSSIIRLFSISEYCSCRSFSSKSALLQRVPAAHLALRCLLEIVPAGIDRAVCKWRTVNFKDDSLQNFLVSVLRSAAGESYD